MPNTETLILFVLLAMAPQSGGLVAFGSRKSRYEVAF
jgi:hypothetical protein